MRVRLEDVVHEMEDIDLLLHIVVNLPTSYDTVVEIVQDDFNNGSLTLEVLRTKLNAKFKRLHKVSERNEEKGLYIAYKKGSIKCKLQVLWKVRA